MFSFFRKKEVVLSPKTKILNQFKANVDGINDLLARPNSDITNDSISLLKEDNIMLGELYATVTEPSIVFNFDYKKQSNDDILDSLLIPRNRVVYDIVINTDEIKPINEKVGFNLIKNIRTGDYLNTEESYSNLQKLLDRRDAIKSSRLKSKIKELVIDKQIKKLYNSIVENMFSKMLPTTYTNLIDDLDNIGFITFYYIRSLETLYITKYNNPHDDFYKTLVFSNYSYLNDSISDFSKDLLESHQILVVGVQK